MDRQLAERMVGAACLLAVLVLVVPAILDGNPDPDATLTHPEANEAIDLRTHTIRLDGSDGEPPVPTARQSAPATAAAPEPRTEPEPEPEPQRLPETPVSPSTGGDQPPPPVARPDPPAEAARPPAKPKAEPKAEPNPNPTPRAEPAPSPAGDWMVQLGSFSRRENADRLAADVRRRGFAVVVQSGGGSGGTMYRVRVGPEPDKAAAEALAGRLSAAGFKGGRVGR